jgi:hypothetical protein
LKVVVYFLLEDFPEEEDLDSLFDELFFPCEAEDPELEDDLLVAEPTVDLLELVPEDTDDLLSEDCDLCSALLLTLLSD